MLNMEVVLEDSGEFARKNQQREGSIKVADLKRLAAACVSASGELQWTVRGSISQFGFPQLDLAVKGRVELMCQRCLEVFSFELDSRSAIILAGSEEEADGIEDKLAADDAVEVIAAGDVTDLLVLVEDEALLALPFSPRHEVCPGATGSVAGSLRESPFSVLRGLKTGKGQKGDV
ncbi:MAG: YceD family protein [Burkholderiaceae bacterium]|jgi:uncharacterized protein|nr:YceD family protein [Burkholderiaceae bacterium]